MAQPPRFESKGECVCHLKKSIYGLKQSPCAWFDKFSKAIVYHDMTRNQTDHSVFFKETKIGIVILVVYVDDIVITGNDKEGISLSQRKYTLDILQDTSYLGFKPVATPMESNLKLMPDEGDFIDDPDTYRRLVVIRILKYLKNAPGRGLFYRSFGHLRIEEAVSCGCAMAHTTCELTWLRTVLQEFGLLTQSPTPLYCDNQAAIHIASNPVFHERTKHIEVDCHFVRSKMESKDIITPFVPSRSQLADIFTKALPKNAIDSICSKLGVIDIYSPA
uniref:Reverse transcriptase Ty1/copia-type domain-containing protein n=1 Tax=Fagus sylvatica TaxID=28930 RepID=A0A2N9FRK8_FAGSY